jgi:hypothetical protein
MYETKHSLRLSLVTTVKQDLHREDRAQDPSGQ